MTGKSDPCGITSADERHSYNLSLSGVRIVAHFEGGCRIRVSVHRRREMQTGRNNCRGPGVAIDIDHASLKTLSIYKPDK